MLSVVAPEVVEYVLLPHARQALSATAPVVVRYLPAPQLVHASEPVVVLYFPAAHAEHGPPSGPVYPRLQRQLASCVDPAGDCEFDGQAWQVLVDVAPRAPEYLPASQSVHDVAPAAEYFPGALTKFEMLL